MIACHQRKITQMKEKVQNVLNLFVQAHLRPEECVICETSSLLSCHSTTLSLDRPLAQHQPLTNEAKENDPANVKGFGMSGACKLSMIITKKSFKSHGRHKVGHQRNSTTSRSSIAPSSEPLPPMPCRSKQTEFFDINGKAASLLSVPRSVHTDFTEMSLKRSPFCLPLDQ